MDNPHYDKEQVLSAQKAFLEQKRNRLNGIIELITDVMKGVHTMSFEAFNNEDVQKIINHMLGCMSKERMDEEVQKHGSMEKYKEHLASGFTNEQAMADLLKWYGSKEKAMEAILQSTGNTEEIKRKQPTASSEKAVPNMLRMPFNIIMEHLTKSNPTDNNLLISQREIPYNKKEATHH